MRGAAELRREQIGVVFQQFNLIPSLTVAANLAFQARLAGRLDAAWQEELTVAPRAHRTGRAISGATLRRPAAARRHRPRARYPAAASACG